MSQTEPFEIFLMAAPGLEPLLQDETAALGFHDPQVVPGGVTIQGTWPDVWRANLQVRGAGRVLARIGSFRAMHLAQLDKRARKFPWSDVLRQDVPIRVEATCRKSRIYHANAAKQRVETALSESSGLTVSAEAALTLRVRIEDDLCTFSIDTSGEALHKRGHKAAVGKAPMRETFAALFLRACEFDGREPVVDPMCGSGTFVIEAAEIAAGLAPGRSRSFGFEQLASFDAKAWQELREAPMPVAHTVDQNIRFYGSDRDQGAVQNATANAQKAGVAESTVFTRQAISELSAPEGPKGLVIVNPPYGARIGNRKLLFGLYGSMGQVLKSQFKGWRVGIITSDGGLAKATGLPFRPTGAPVAHGGLTVKLYQTGRL